MKRLVIGILAHVDSGKTTLSEGLLYHAGEIRKRGRVDHGDAFLDTHSLERSRGITIFSKQAVLHCGDTVITLLDTPGHVDFSLEAERTLQVLDYAVLVINGSDGVQSHTETLWKLLERYNVPVFIFVNKMDIAGRSREDIMSELTSGLSSACVDFTAEDDSFYENTAVCDEALMEQYLDGGSIDAEHIKSAIAMRKIYPCMFGSALKDDGAAEFLEMLDKYTRQPVYGGEFGAKVFKIAEDEQKNRLTYMKITGGSLKVKTVLIGDKWSEKVNQIRIYSGAKFQPVDEAPAGSVCAVTGLTQTFPGEGLGTERNSLPPILEPVLSYRVIPDKTVDTMSAYNKLKKLEEEDPQLHIVWNERLKEIHISVMGEIQLEILRSIIAERLGFQVQFDCGGIVYKETIANKVEGVGHYEPLRHYAEVHLILEPLERGSGLKFATSCREDRLDRNWQRLILTHLEEKTHIGTLTGSPITDMKITLAAGKAHLKHTEGGDFRQATYRAVRNGLMQAESILLEPWYSFRLEVPDDSVGRAITDIQRMCGEFGAPVSDGKMSVLEGSVPVSEMQGYHTEVMGYTHGKGRLFCILKGYYPCHNAEEVIAASGYDAESDIDNTADSVFCAHGAGFVVKWDDVHNYMHLESVLSDKPEDEYIPVHRRVEESKDGYAADKELMDIFERTYGKINRDERSAMKTRKEPPAVKMKAVPLQTGPEYVLVDGYNIIFSWDELKEAAADNLDLARSMLINTMCNYQGFRKCEVIVVFDAYRVKGGREHVEKVHNITVVYTKEAETADTYIERTTHEIGKNHRVRVATSDNLEQVIILGNGAFRVSAGEFYREVKAVEEKIRNFIN
ncbi:MAG: NYN domain-containing protein [Oscillospiraceae bacterium]